MKCTFYVQCSYLWISCCPDVAFMKGTGWIGIVVPPCCSWSGAGAKAPVALQPLGLLYTLFSRSSHCHCQMSPRPTRRERSKQREVELWWARKCSREFCLNADFHVTFRVLLHAANLRHGTAGFTSPPKEGVLGIFLPWKLRWLRPGLNLRTWVLEANTHPVDHRSCCCTFVLYKSQVR
jgi:hypothetical protein